MEVFYGDIRRKTERVKRKHGNLALIGGRVNAGNGSSVVPDGFRVTRLFEGIISADDEQALYSRYLESKQNK